MKRSFWLVSMCASLTASSLGIATAAHPSWICLDVGPDTSYPVGNDDTVDRLLARVGASDAGHPQQNAGCVTDDGPAAEGTDIYFEVTGVGDTDGDTPETPDMTCAIPAEADGCSVEPPASSGGSQIIRAWLDEGETAAPDRAEGPDETYDAGDSPEPDTTDVTEWIWTHHDPPPPPCGSDGVCWGRVTIDYEARDNQFLGRIRREHDSCRTGSVTLRKKRPGRDRKVAEALVSGPYWEVVLDHGVSGRFYAALSRTRTHSGYTNWPEYPCAGDRSPVLTID